MYQMRVRYQISILKYAKAKEEHIEQFIFCELQTSVLYYEHLALLTERWQHVMNMGNCVAYCDTCFVNAQKQVL